MQGSPLTVERSIAFTLHVEQQNDRLDDLQHFESSCRPSADFFTCLEDLGFHEFRSRDVGCILHLRRPIHSCEFWVAQIFDLSDQFGFWTTPECRLEYFIPQLHENLHIGTGVSVRFGLCRQSVVQARSIRRTRSDRHHAASTLHWNAGDVRSFDRDLRDAALHASQSFSLAFDRHHVRLWDFSDGDLLHDRDVRGHDDDAHEGVKNVRSFASGE